MNVTHDPNNKDAHFPGCGIQLDECTDRPCCEDALRNQKNSSNCGYEPEELLLFDAKSFSY